MNIINIRYDTFCDENPFQEKTRQIHYQAPTSKNRKNCANVFFQKLINQLQVRIQAEPPHGKYSGGNSASFSTSIFFLKNMFFPDPLNLLLGTSDDSKWHPKGPRTILGKNVFWPSSTFLVAALCLVLQEEDLLLAQENNFSIRHHRPLFATIRHYAPLFATIRHYSPLFSTIRNCTPLFATIDHYSPLYWSICASIRSQLE